MSNRRSGVELHAIYHKTSVYSQRRCPNSFPDYDVDIHKWVDTGSQGRGYTSMYSGSDGDVLFSKQTPPRGR